MGQKVERQCPVCGGLYLADTTRLRWGRETTCGRKCSYRRRGDNLQDQISFICAVCGAEGSRARTHIKGKYGAQFCTPECHYAGRSLGLTRRVVTKPYVYTERGRTNLSKAGALTYAAGKTLRYPKTESAVAERFTTLGIPFDHQHVFEHSGGAFSVDFFFPDRSLVIELDRKATHQRRINKDRERDSILASFGIRVIRIPDNGILHEVTRAAILAVTTC